jgi:hypothetical protein
MIIMMITVMIMVQKRDRDATGGLPWLHVCACILHREIFVNKDTHFLTRFPRRTLSLTDPDPSRLISALGPT